MGRSHAPELIYRHTQTCVKRCQHAFHVCNVLCGKGMTAERLGESFMGCPPLSPLSSCRAVVGFSVLAQHDLAVRGVCEEGNCGGEESVSLPEGATGLPAAIRQAYLLMKARYIQIFITLYGFSSVHCL